VWRVRWFKQSSPAGLQERRVGSKIVPRAPATKAVKDGSRGALACFQGDRYTEEREDAALLPFRDLGVTPLSNKKMGKYIYGGGGTIKYRAEGAERAACLWWCERSGARYSELSFGGKMFSCRRRAPRE